MIPQIKQAGLADAVDAFCEGIAFSPEQVARVFDAAKASGLPVKLHADQLSNLHGAALAARYDALSADHLEYTDETGVAAMAQSGTVAVLLPGAFYVLREKQLPPVEALRRHKAHIAIATDCNPGTSPITSLLLTMNMAATLFRLTVEECIAGVTREAARALGKLDDYRHHRGRQVLRPRDLEYRAAGRTGLPARLQSAACAGLARQMTDAVTFSGDALPLSDWRKLARGAQLALSPDVFAKVDQAAAVVAAIVAKGEAVYGINTGFGKLANVRIADQRSRNAAAQSRALACRRRRRACLGADRAADDGAETRQPRPRRFRHPARDPEAAARHADRQCDPGDPGARLGRRVGRSRAARASRRQP